MANQTDWWKVLKDMQVKVDPQGKVSVKGPAGSSVSVDTKTGNTTISGSGGVGGVSVGGSTTVHPDGTISGDNITVGVKGPGGISIKVDIKPAGTIPHPTDPSAPPIPAVTVTPSVGVGPVTHKGDTSDPISPDHILDPEVPGSPLSGGLLGEAYRAVRHRQREIDRAVDEAVNGGYQGGLAPPPRDPLAIDLDGDGIETVGVGSNPILFDHDNNGIKTGTGWVSSDDGWLVLDRNGNGTIDSGRELFGVDTLITDPVTGQERTATTGFEALRSLDANGDNVFDANDAAFSQVKLWRDLNQDGISQAGELSGLSDLGIVSIGLTPTNGTINLGNGNSITGSATVTRSNGSTTEVESVSLGSANNLNLGDNPFYREFTDEIPLTAEAQALPEMRGSGAVRDLREAMSLGTSQADALVDAVQAFSAGTTRDAQRAVLDDLLHAWASTEAVAGSLNIEAVGQETRHFVVAGSNDPALRARLDRVIPVLEVFNGFAVEVGGWTSTASTVNGQTTRTYSITAGQASLMLAAYDKLVDSVYNSLVAQTRLQPYLDAVELVLDEDGLRLDSSGLSALLETRRASDELGALIDLVELHRYGSSELLGSDFEGIGLLRSWIDALPVDSPVRDALGSLGVRFSNSSTGSSGADIYLGDAAANVFHGGAGNDTIEGGAGNDTLVGGDQSSGPWNGANYYSGHGNDTYVFGRGDGQDIIWDNDSAAGNLDTIRLREGVAASDVRITRAAGSNNLVLSINGTTDKITVTNFFVGDGSNWAIEQVAFADGTIWSLADIKAQALLSTDGNDDITGYASSDTISAGDGNDRVWAGAGDDVVEGGAGSDELRGEGGADVLQGNDGNDLIVGGTGNDLIEGGAGNDVLVGGDESSGPWNGANYYSGHGNDTYVFGRGDGQDTIWDNDSTVGNLDTIRLKEGVASSDVRITRPTGSNDLVLSINGTTDKVTVTNFFVGDGSTWAIEQVAFADGTTWDLAAIKAQALLSTSDNDDLTGYAGNDTISAGDGNDRVWAGSGDDTVEGGAGSDELRGEGGADDLQGGDGNDLVVGGTGNDLIEGGAGNDILVGGDESSGPWNGANYYSGHGNDTYVFGRGDGQDTVWDNDSTAGNLDTIRLKEGIATSDVRITRAAGSNNLVLSINGTTDKVTVTNFFVGDGSTWAIEQVVFADGTTWDLAAIKAQALLSTSGNDDLTGYASNDTISAGDGSDRVWAGAGDDTVQGGAGSDELRGEAGADDLQGGDGNDLIVGGTGNDLLEGGAGNDVLVGGDESSGPWNGANYYSGHGNDTYVFGRGDGQDTIWDNDSTVGNLDTIRLKEGIAEGDVRITRAEGSNNLVLSISGTADKITVVNFFASDTWAIEQVAFADGTSWDLAAIKAQALLSTSGNDDLTGYASNDTISAGDGNDRVWAGAGDDTVQGGAGSDEIRGEGGADNLQGDDGNDLVVGGTGNDLIEGGAGNDTLVGGDESSGPWNGGNYYSGHGNDTYVFGRGDGQDIIWDNDSTAGNLDTIRLKEGVATSDVRFSRAAGSNDLVLSINGTTDKITVVNFFVGDGSTWAIEQVAFADGTTWDLATIKARALSVSATNNADDLTGYATDDWINGLDGNDRIWGRAGNDLLQGGGGNDELRGEDGTDELQGGDGNDLIVGGTGHDTLDGGAGNDVLVGGDESSGPWNGGNYYSGHGNDTYVFGRGDGQDTIWDNDSTVGNLDTIRLKEGVATSDVRITRPAGSNNLILSILGTTDQITVVNFFVGDGTTWAIEQVTFADGTTWDLAAIKAQALLSTSGNDDITGYASNDTISAGDGNDRVWAGAGNDTVQGGAGSDELRGEGGADSLQGDEGSDLIVGGTGNDTLEGGAGNDVLVGGDESSGPWNGGNYYSGHGNDTYVFGRGDGQDTIWDNDSTVSNLDTIRLKEGIATSDVRITRAAGSNNLVLSINGTADKITVVNFFASDTWAIEQVTFADGTTWDLAAIKAQALLSTLGNDDITGYTSNDTISAGDGNDRVWAGAGDDVVEGGAGSDELRGEGGADVLQGNDGNDLIVGGTGNDLIEGGAGNDILVGGDESSGPWNGANYYSGHGNDTYVFGRGDGQDTIWDNDSTAGNLDTIRLKEGIATSDVRITRPAGSSNLILSILGTTDKITVTNFFASDTWAIEQVAFADGTTWDLAAIKAQALLSSTGNDDIIGYASNDTISAGEGNDRVWAGAGDDAVQGGAGSDELRGEGGADVLQGDDGNDLIVGGTGHDTLEGGTGNDVLVGGDESSGPWNGANYYSGHGNDTYVFGRGDGQDTIWDNDSTAGNLDTIRLKEGIATSDVRLTRAAGSNNLVLSINGTTDRITVTNFFVGDGTTWAIEQVAFADGTTWDLAAIKAQALLSSTGNDDITGYASNDTISAGDGNDRVWAGAGDDTVQGGAGADEVRGEGGADNLQGGDGNDLIVGGTGNDLIEGGAGNDTLVGGDESSGPWNGANYYSGHGNDTYVFGRGDGQDTIWDNDSTVGNLDTIRLKEGVATSDVRITRPAGSNDLVLSINGTTDKVTVTNFFVGDGTTWAIEQVAFADGTTWDLAAIKAQALLSTSSNDDITGYASNDTISAGDGNDRVWAGAGNDTVQGGAGSDELRGDDGADDLQGGDGGDFIVGGTGHDTLQGGAGNDVLVGGTEGSGPWNGANYYSGHGNDTYVFGRGDGQDTVWDNDSTAGNSDSVVFGDGVSADQLWFRHVGSNLEVSIIGTQDKITITNWYTSASYRTEQFQTAGGQSLSHGQVNALVDAMASFAVPAAGQTTLPADYQAALNPVIAANWTSS